MRHHVQLAVRVLAERRNAAGRAHVPLAQVADLAVLIPERAHIAATEVRVEDRARERRQCLAAVGVAAGHRAAVIVVVLDHGLHEVGGAGARQTEAMQRLAHAPTVVGASARGGHDVHFLVLVLADVGDDQALGGHVERPTPWVAQPGRPDLRGAGLRAALVGVAIGNAVRLAMVHVHAQHLAQQRMSVLAVAQGIAARAAVAHADVQHAVGAKRDAAAVVIRERLLDGQDRLRTRGLDRLPVATHRVAHDLRGAILVGVVHEQVAVAFVCGMERQPQQAALAAIAHDLGKVGEHRGRWLAVLDPADAARLLDHEHARVARGDTQEDGVIEARRHDLELQSIVAHVAGGGFRAASGRGGSE